jgi:hypothetical protein
VSGTVVEVLARLKADSGDFTRGMGAAKQAARSMKDEANAAARGIEALDREMIESAAVAELASGRYEKVSRSMAQMSAMHVDGARAAREMAGEVTIAGQALRANSEEAKRLGGVFRDVNGVLRESNGRFFSAGNAAEKAAGQFSGLDREARKAGGGGGGLSAMVSGFGKWGAISAGVLAVGPQLLSYLQQLSGLIALVPALAGAGAIAIGTLAIGLSGFTKALQSSADPKKFAAALALMPPAAREAAVALAGLAPTLRGFRSLIQESLFTGMAANFRLVGGTLLPAVAGGFRDVASAINHVVTDLTKFWTSANGLAIWHAMLAGTHALIERMRGGFVALSHAIGTVAAVGSKFLGGIGGGFTGAMQRFDAFIQKVAASGALGRFIQGGIDAFGTLVNVIHSVGMIFESIVKAIRTSMGGLGGGFSELLRNIAVFLNSAKGQNAMVSLFDEIHRLVVGVGDALRAVGSVAVAIAPVVAVLARVAEWLVKNQTFAKILAAGFLLMWAASLGPVALVIATIALVVAGLRNGSLVVKILTAAFVILWAAAFGPIAAIIAAIAMVALGLKYAYDHCKWFRDAVDAVWSFAKQAFNGIASVILSMTAIGLRAFASFEGFVIGVLVTIAKAAAKALGWVPGLGGQLKTAAAAMESFRDTTVAALNLAAAYADNLAAHLDDAARPRTAVINIVTRQIQAGDTPLHTGQVVQSGPKAPPKVKPPPPPPTNIPQVGGGGFGKIPATPKPKSTPLKSLPPVLANIPIVNDTSRLAKMVQTLAGVMTAAGKAITLSFVSPLQAATQTVTTAGAAAAKAQQHFAFTVSAAAIADRQAAVARSAYLAQHAKTVEMLKASNGKMTDAIKLQERAEAAAKKAADAAVNAAKKGGAAAIAAYNAAAAAAKTLRDAETALAQVNYDAMRTKAQTALDAIAAKIDAVKAKIDGLVQTFASGVNQVASMSSTYGNVFTAMQAQADAAMQAQQTATDNLAAANQNLAAAQQAVLNSDPTQQARNNVAVLKSAADLAKALGVSVDRIANISDVPDAAQQAAQQQLDVARQAVALAQGAASQAAQAAAAATAAFDPTNIAAQVQQSLTATLNTAQSFLSDLTNLQTLGASDALIQQIAEMGPVAGDAFAKALLTAGKPAILQMGATIAAIDKVTTDGITRLASKMYSPMLDATTKALLAMKGQFAQVFGEIADQVTALMAQISGLTAASAGAGVHVTARPAPIRGIVPAPVRPPESPIKTAASAMRVTVGDVNVTVPATAAGVTAEHVAAAVEQGVTDAMSGVRRVLEAA